MNDLSITMYNPVRDYLNHENEYDTAIKNILNQGCFINGPAITELENKLANYIGSTNCIAVASGTDALLVALMALDVKPGDEIITVAHTWISSSEVISLLGAIPVFIDIDPNTFIMDLNLIEKAITEKTVGILPVQIYGNMVDIDKISHIAKSNNLWIIEDAAQSFGSSLNNIKSCSWATISCTSFFPSKPLGCYGDAGACFTNDKTLADKIRAIKSHGGLVRMKHDYIGINGRMDTLQAAILLVKFKYFSQALKRRQDIANRYTKELQNIPWLQTPQIINGLQSAFAQYSIIIPDNPQFTRDTITEKLKLLNIQISIFYTKGLHQQPCFNYLTHNPLPNTEYVCNHIINIPLYAELTDNEISYIINCIKIIFS